MCSKPETFINKYTGQEVTTSCRNCEECLKVRRGGWVARAMAEKTQWSHTLCVALSYDDTTQENRDAAKFFAYTDVRDFMKRLLSACRRKQRGARVKFLCAGEQGDENGRCHWHMILYSDLDLTQIGVVKGIKHRKRVVLTDRRDMLTVGRIKKRLNWSIWGKGFVTFQEADQGGMQYVLSYCLKDQFTIEKSEGTKREAKAENFATGLFRMSKYPPIGETWLMQKMEGLDAQGAVLPSLNLKVPGLSGYWHPNGLFREKLLWCLVALNQRALWATGAHAPQWPALLSSCSENENDLEVLNGPQTDPDNETSLETAIGLRAGEVARQADIRRTQGECGGLVPCSTCLRSLDPATWAEIGVEPYDDWDGQTAFRSVPGFPSLAERRATGGGAINIYCQNKTGKAQRFAFPRSTQAHWLPPEPGS